MTIIKTLRVLHASTCVYIVFVLKMDGMCVNLLTCCLVPPIQVQIQLYSSAEQERESVTQRRRCAIATIELNFRKMIIPI